VDSQIQLTSCLLSFHQRPYGMKKHWATHLHYDLRLEWNGYLLSWAIRMGPSRDPGITREAIEMEDHRSENLDFEGIHESGTIMFWDRGTWELHPESEDVESCLHQGVLRFILHAEKLKGGWTLTRAGRNQHDRPIWTLSKDNDEFAVHDTDDLLHIDPNSVKTKRTMVEIEHHWNESKKISEHQMLLFQAG
jgi:bifunctional non-homologous end joining protein LigD